MSAIACPIGDCRHNRAGECAFAKERDGVHDMRCAHGAFAELVERRLSRFGDWKIRAYKDGPMRATLRGRAGAVEVWGGAHAREVWFIPKGGHDSEMVYWDWDGARDALEEAVAQAIALAGVQARLELEVEK